MYKRLLTAVFAGAIISVSALAQPASATGRTFEPGYAMSKQYVAVTTYKILRDHAADTIGACESDVKNEPDRFDDLGSAGAFTRGAINCLDKLGYVKGLPGGSDPFQGVIPLDLSDQSLTVTAETNNRRPVIGTRLTVTATIADESGEPIVGAGLMLYIDSAMYDGAISDSLGRATFVYDGPRGDANEGGYDSLHIGVWSNDSVSRPIGVFWQQSISSRIDLEVSPDSPHSRAERTLTATLHDGDKALPGRLVNLSIDGEVVGSERTNDDGVARFTRTEAFRGPFDLAKATLAGNPNVVSEEVLISWPMTARGSHSGNNWKLIWHDEFDGDSIDASKWTVSDNCPPVNLACETSRVENVELADGRLYLRLLRENYSGTNSWKTSGDQFGDKHTFTPEEFYVREFTAARIETRKKHSFTFGRFELLGKLPTGHGTFFAWWLRPENSPYGSGASGGEIDIAEGANIGVPGVDAQLLHHRGWGIHHVVHMGYPFTNPYSLTNLPVDPSKSYHLYAAEWDTASIRFYVDGQRVLTVPQSDWFAKPKNQSRVDNEYAPFDVPFALVVNNTVGNWATETAPGNKVPDSTVFPAEFVVDYVRVYECQPPSGSSLGPGQGCETP